MPPKTSHDLPDQPSPNPDRIEPPPTWLSTAIYRLNNIRGNRERRKAVEWTQSLLSSIEAEEIDAPVITVPPADGASVCLEWKSGGKRLAMIVRSAGTITISQQPEPGLASASCSYKKSPKLLDILRESIRWIYPDAFAADLATMERLTVAAK